MFTRNSQGVPLYYETYGDGEPVLLAAGASSAGSEFVRAGIVDALSSHFRVIVYDYTGLGKSGRVSAVSKSQWVEDIESVLDAEGIQQAHVGGSSLGSRVAGRFALDYPSRVKTLFVDNPITFVDAEGDAALNRSFDKPESSPRAESWRLMHGEDWIDVVKFYARTRIDPEFQQYLTLRDHIASIEAPTLIMRGDLDDHVHPLDQAPEWHRRARHSWLWIAPGSNSGAIMAQFTAQFVDLLRTFTTDNRSQSSSASSAPR